MSADSSALLREYGAALESLARRAGLDFYPVDFETAPANLMLEIAVYGLPVRMPHWSFGVRYIHQLARQSMGHSKIFEVMFPGDPCLAYLMDTNTLAENTLVTAHVFGHADFARNNHLFARFHEMVGGNIVGRAAEHAHSIEAAIHEHGIERVEPVLDAALALEQHVDVDRELYRDRYPEFATAAEVPGNPFRERFKRLPGAPAPRAAPPAQRRAPVPPHPERDLLWFVASYAPELEQWERDIFLAVREESFYFYPVFACQIMNEGWASYWHARLLREADFLPQDLYLSAIKSHSDVVRPFAAEQQVALALNPYHLGFSIWEHVVERQGLERALEIRRDEDDFGFVRNFLDEALSSKLGLFVYSAKDNAEVKVTERNIHALRETILAPKFNYGAPRVAVGEVKVDGSLELVHEHSTDGRGLDRDSAQRVLHYLGRVWKRPVRLRTVDASGAAATIEADGAVPPPAAPAHSHPH